MFPAILAPIDPAAVPADSDASSSSSDDSDASDPLANFDREGKDREDDGDEKIGEEEGWEEDERARGSPAPHARLGFGPVIINNALAGPFRYLSTPAASAALRQCSSSLSVFSVPPCGLPQLLSGHGAPSGALIPRCALRSRCVPQRREDGRADLHSVEGLEGRRITGGKAFTRMNPKNDR